MTEEERVVRRVIDAIHTWPREDQLWWRTLLEVAPQEALIVARLVVGLDARPLGDDALELCLPPGGHNMSRLIEERWLNAGFGVEEEQVAKATPEGAPVMNGDGSPLMEKLTVLVLVRNSPDGQHVIRIPFDQGAKQKLVQQLSGGIIVPGISGIKGLEGMGL